MAICKTENVCSYLIRQARTQKVRAFRGMKDTKYNGWTNYATWRINLEILGDIEFEEKVNADYLEEIVCLLYTSPSPRDLRLSRMPSSA